MSERREPYGMQKQEPIDFSFEVEVLIAWLVKNSPVGWRGERGRIITLLNIAGLALQLFGSLESFRDKLQLDNE